MEGRKIKKMRAVVFTTLWYDEVKSVKGQKERVWWIQQNVERKEGAVEMEGGWRDQHAVVILALRMFGCKANR